MTHRPLGIGFLGPVRDIGNVVSRGLQRLGVHAPHAEAEWRGYVSLTDPEKRHAFGSILNAVVGPGGQTVSAHDRLHLAAHLPTLIVWGRKDRIIPVSHAYAAQKALPRSTLEIFELSGHFPHVEEPERFVRVLTNFLESTEPQHPEGEGRNPDHGKEEDWASVDPPYDAPGGRALTDEHPAVAAGEPRGART